MISTEVIDVLLVPSGDLRHDETSGKDVLGRYTLERCKRALELWKTDRYQIIITTGGLVLDLGPGGSIMKNWFVEQGVPEGVIIVESQALDTFQNVRFSLKVLPENCRITVVSQWQHAIRFWLAFKAYNVEIVRYPLHYKMRFQEWLVEWLFILYHLLDPKGGGLLARRSREERSDKGV